ncbi:MAG: DNA/RNA non-specific endonuclease, partial [Chloroflexota bacterium]
QVGRATGVIALLTPDSIRTESRGFRRATDKDYRRAYGGRVAIRPPGYLSGKGVTQAGHLLGYELGGPVRNPRNFVTQWNLANAPAQSSLEDAIRTELSQTDADTSSLTVFVRIAPQYQGSCVVPYEVDYQAVGSDGWQLPTATKGIAAQWLSFAHGADGITLARIRNAERSGNTWLVPGQDPQAVCVPSGYAG